MLWWMDVDLENSLKLFGDKYNDIQSKTTIKSRAYGGIYDSLPSTFEKSDLLAASLKNGIRTPVKIIIYKWKKAGLIKTKDGKFIKNG